MDSSSEGKSRELRAARNQSLFRGVNEKLKGINQAFEVIAGTHAVTCECADLQCIATVEIASDEYTRVRANPRRFVVLRGHIVPEVETVVAEHNGYVVVEKFGEAGEAAEAASGAGLTEKPLTQPWEPTAGAPARSTASKTQG